MGVQVHAEVPQGRAATSFRRSGRDEEMIRAYTRNLELAHKQLDQMQLSSRPHKLQLSVPESFITAFGGSPSNPQLCWGLLALPLLIASSALALSAEMLGLSPG